MDQEEAHASSPFAPRTALVRTPPSGFAPPARQEVDMAPTPTVPLRPHVPGLRPRPPAAPPAPPTTPPLIPTASKRPLTSPEERRPVDVVRMCRPATPTKAPVASAPLAAGLGKTHAVPPPVLPTTRPASPEAGPSTQINDDENDDADDNDNCEDMGALSRASKEALFERVHKDLEAVMAAVTAPTSRITKDSTNSIGASIHDALAVIATLSLRLSEAELKLAEVNLRCKSLEYDVLKARSDAGMAARQPTTTPATPANTPAASTYSSVLRLPKTADPVHIPVASGPVLAFYPAPDQSANLKTAEDTKAELKRAIKPQALEVQVDRVRKVGNAGVVVQTSTPSAAERLRSAVPPTLRVSEPQKRSPRLCLRNIDGDPTEEFILGALHDQNLQGTDWSLQKLKEQAKIFKRRGRQADSTTIIIECTPALRQVLVKKEKVYLGWQAVQVHDHIAATCCHKCQQYGHPERYCKSAEPTCGRCGDTGHRRPDCKAATERCATCHKFNRADASSHVTASRACPARRYAEERAVATTNYGRP